MAETVFVIPLANVPQRFDITVGGKQLNISCKYNEHCGWLLDIYDGVTGSPLTMAVPLVTGADLFAQFPHLNLPGQAIVYTDGDQFAVPTLENLGNESNLYSIVDV